MRIVIVNWQDPRNPMSGGAEEHLHQIFSRLVARGHRVTAVVSGGPELSPHECVHGIDVRRVGGRYSFALVAPSVVRRLLRAEAFDIAIEDLNKIPLFLPRWTSGRSMVVAHHLFGNGAFQAAKLPIGAITWVAERFLGWGYAGTNVVAVSPSTAADLANAGIQAGRITVISNGVDGDFFTPSGAASRYGVPTFAYVGRLVRYKQVDTILRALAATLDRGVAARLIVLGRGPERRRLAALAERWGVRAMVQFRGFVDASIKRDVLRRCWANVVASRKEGWGITCMEAGACGTPTIASFVPGHRDAVVHNQTGVLVPFGDPVALADAMASLARDPAKVERWGAGARERALRFTWDRAADQMEAQLRASIDGRPAPDAGEWAHTYRRHPRQRTPLPRNGPAWAPYRCETFEVHVRERRATVYIGARDPEGHQPVVVVSAAGACVTEELEGWPYDSLSFLERWLTRRYGGGIRVRRIPTPATCPRVTGPWGDPQTPTKARSAQKPSVPTL